MYYMSEVESMVSMGLKGSKNKALTRRDKNPQSAQLREENSPHASSRVIIENGYEFDEVLDKKIQISDQDFQLSNQELRSEIPDGSKTEMMSSQAETLAINRDLDTKLTLERRNNIMEKDTVDNTTLKENERVNLITEGVSGEMTEKEKGFQYTVDETDGRSCYNTELDDHEHKLDSQNVEIDKEIKDFRHTNRQSSKSSSSEVSATESATYDEHPNVTEKKPSDIQPFRKNEPEEMDITGLFRRLEKSLQEMKPENKDWSQAILNLSKCTRTAFQNHQKEIVTVLVKNKIVNKFMTFIKINNIESVANLKLDDDTYVKSWASFKRLLSLFWILCDSSVNFCQYVLNSKLFEYLMLELRVISALSHSLNDKSIYFLKAILGIFHNITRHVPSSKWVFRNEGLVTILRIFLNCDIAMVRVKALIVLSYITSETENEIINSDDENFQFIIQVLTDSLRSNNHMSVKYGMSCLEILKGLCNLAINDENKIRIVKNGALPLYERLLEMGSKEEKKLTVTSLWSLAFHHYNKQKMRDTKGIMEKLHALEFPDDSVDDDEICHAARGTIWELENISAASVDRNYSSSSEKDSQIPHIMISYQWDSQPIMVKVKDKLRQAGYKVWMDVEYMTGSTLEAMALAVEKAAVVLICMSQKYKDSPNCRTEAEYVYRLRKDFVPLRLQQDYAPDGWLGIMVGTRLYFDVHTEEVIDLQIPRLVKELRDRGKISPIFDTVDQGLIAPARMLSREAAPLITSRSMEVTAWTQTEVRSWFSSSGCGDLVERLPVLDGPLLSELQHIQGRAPEFFYSILKSELNLTVTEILKFSKCLRNLTK